MSMTLEQMAAIMAELDIDSSDEEQEENIAPFTTGETKQGDTVNYILLHTFDLHFNSIMIRQRNKGFVFYHHCINS